MKKYKIISIIVFFIFISCCIFLSNSSYINKVILKSKNQLDNPIINLYVEDNIFFENVNSETEFQEIKFKVTNFQDEKINSAKIKYYIEIVDGIDNEYFEYVLVDEDNKEIMINNKRTEEFSIKLNEKEEKIYSLKINNRLPKDIIQNDINIKLKLSAIQEI